MFRKISITADSKICQGSGNSRDKNSHLKLSHLSRVKSFPLPSLNGHRAMYPWDDQEMKTGVKWLKQIGVYFTVILP